MGIPILLIRLEGVLQSWEDSSKLDYRNTGDFPSKSGVVGMLGCALGLERGNKALGEMSKALNMIVRADRAGELLIDYHTVTSKKMLNAKGESRSVGGTIISNRSYLQDASFLVGLTGERELLHKLEEALRKPKWEMYLGRKSCVPSVPILGIYTEKYASLLEAMERYRLTPRHDKLIIVEMESENGEGTERADERKISEKMEYETRRVSVRAIEVREDSNVSE